MEEKHDKHIFIGKTLDDLFKLWVQRIAYWGALLFILFSALDYFVAREHFAVLLVYRLAASSLLLSIGRLSAKFVREDVKLHKIAVYIGIIGSALSIELTIFTLGGHASPYFAGQILLAICVMGFSPARLFFLSSYALLIYCIYLLPLVIFDTITDYRTFLISNALMIASFISLLLMRFLSNKSIMQELDLKFELSREIAERRKSEEERERLILQLQDAIAKVKTLSGLLPICSCCKKIRDDKGYWNQIETYISKNSDAVFSHGLCPECKKKSLQELEEFIKGSDKGEEK